MFWQEDENKNQQPIPEDVVDLLFSIQCRNLPVDHAHALFEELTRIAPWIADDPGIGIHAIHVAGSQNGWERPDPDQGQMLHLSRRTKLTLRVPQARLEAVQEALSGQTLDIAGNALTVGAAKTRLLSRQGTVFARYLALEAGEETDEDRFLARAVAELGAMRIRVRKALCGMTTELGTPQGPLATRSLMLAELSPDESIELQEQGLGPHRHLGCGIFIPHKGIEAVGQAVEDK